MSIRGCGEEGSEMELERGGTSSSRGILRRERLRHAASQRTQLLVWDANGGGSLTFAGHAFKSGLN